MPNIKEVKNRIENVRDTKKITNAMYLIASTKVRKAKAELEATRPYFTAVHSGIRRVFRLAESVQNRHFSGGVESAEESGSEGKIAILLITADKGLAGAYNQNVIKEALKICEENEGVKLYIVGEYGRRYFASHDTGDDSVSQTFLFSAQNPNLNRARHIALILDDDFKSGKIDRVYVVYTDFGGGLVGGVASTELLLPLDKESVRETEPAESGSNSATESEKNAVPEGQESGGGYVTTKFEFFPSASAILDSLALSYMTGFIYSALVDSFCSEQNARMSAMDAANQNAEELLSKLNLEYNHMRQAAITQEITEISAGAKAKKRANSRN